MNKRIICPKCNGSGVIVHYENGGIWSEGCKECNHTGTVENWVDFDKEKPMDGQYVLAVTSEGEMEVLYFDEDWPNCLCQYNGNLKVYNITHWMSLPKLPNTI